MTTLITMSNGDTYKTKEKITRETLQVKFFLLEDDTIINTAHVVSAVLMEDHE